MGFLMSGCLGTTGQSRAFPATWPGSQPLAADTPIVQILPIQIAPIAAGASDATGEGLPTAAVLSALFVKHLHVNGINAVLALPEGQTARYLLPCRVPQLNYEFSEGYPQTRTYRAQMSCQLVDAQTGESLWQRQLDQRFDRTTVLDLMTKLPTPIHSDDRIMYQECIVPLWDAMAQSVGTVVRSREEWAAAEQSAQAPAEPAKTFEAAPAP